MLRSQGRGAIPLQVAELAIEFLTAEKIKFQLLLHLLQLQQVELGLIAGLFQLPPQGLHLFHQLRLSAARHCTTQAGNDSASTLRP